MQDQVLDRREPVGSTRPGEWGFEAVGEQPEGIFPTHWQDRGGSNTWNPSWVISQVLSTALRLPEAG